MEPAPGGGYSYAMLMEYARLLAGLSIALFHAPLANFLRRQDRALADAFRERGVAIPGELPEKAAHDLIFLFGILLALFGLVRIWLTLL
jgi:hypothetical protein